MSINKINCINKINEIIKQNERRFIKCFKVY